MCTGCSRLAPAPTMSDDILFLVNPVSGGRTGAGLKASLETVLDELGLRDRCETAFTAPDGSLNVRKDIAGYAAVIAAGGDGTVARIVQHLARLEKKPRLGIIPCGTGNDLARVAGSYRAYRHRGLRALVPALLAGIPRPLDVFSVNDRLYFTNYCGIGLDAAISNDFNRRRHAPCMRLAAAALGGRAVYPWFALRNLCLRLPFALDLEWADESGQPRSRRLAPGVRQVLVTGIPSYAAGARPAFHCCSHDGLFEVTVVQTLRQWLLLHMTRFAPLALPRLLPPEAQFRTGELTLRVSGSTCFQADGELYEGFPGPGRPLVIRPAGRLELIFV